MNRVHRALVGVACASVVAFLTACNGSKGSSSGGTASVNTQTAALSPADGSTLPDAIVGQSYSQTFTVTSGGTPPYSFNSSAAPAGLAFTSSNSVGLLAGTPTQTGRGVVQVLVTDARGYQTLAQYLLTVDGPGGTLQISPASAPSGTLNVPYAFDLGVVGGTAPFNFTTTGQLPPGLTLGPSPSGVNGQAEIGGSPAAQGTYTFSIKVTDSSSPTKSGTARYSITIQ